MDGKFVKNQTRDYVPLKNHIKKPIDLHLMVEDVPTYLEHYQQMHPEIVTFHVEVFLQCHHTHCLIFPRLWHDRFTTY